MLFETPSKRDKGGEGPKVVCMMLRRLRLVVTLILTRGMGAAKLEALRYLRGKAITTSVESTLPTMHHCISRPDMLGAKHLDCIRAIIAQGGTRCGQSTIIKM